MGNILRDLCQDMWLYISYGYLKLKVVSTETGSSVMAHKINPIDFENAEGNLGIANALMDFLSLKLPISRWQRDLTDSTTLRNIGICIAYSTLAYEACIRGVEKLEVATEVVQHDLEQAWEVLAEPVQTVMRRYGIDDSYEQLKQLTRGKPIDRETLHGFIAGLDIPEPEKKRLRELTPETYIGDAVRQARSV